MLYEPSRKTYYRFPSSHSIATLDSKHYFPEKPPHTEENTRFDSKLAKHVPERENYYDI